MPRQESPVQPERASLEPNLQHANNFAIEDVDELPPGFVPAVDELKCALEFIEALQEATLDADGLDEEVLARLRHPPQEPFDFVDPDLRLSLKLFISTTNSSQQTYADIRQDVPCRNQAPSCSDQQSSSNGARYVSQLLYCLHWTFQGSRDVSNMRRASV